MDHVLETVLVFGAGLVCGILVTLMALLMAVLPRAYEGDLASEQENVVPFERKGRPPA